MFITKYRREIFNGDMLARCEAIMRDETDGLSRRLSSAGRCVRRRGQRGAFAAANPKGADGIEPTVQIGPAALGVAALDPGQGSPLTPCPARPSPGWLRCDHAGGGEE
ncbi:hypothetical protein ACFY3M_41060 [Streptomyces mirabilis]|uniref:hypothetical protein n=1 Tax=Streptomyces mirabilis TaxID=68239 RepID=UPI00367B10B6